MKNCAEKANIPISYVNRYEVLTSAALSYNIDILHARFIMLQEQVSMLLGSPICFGTRPLAKAVFLWVRQRKRIRDLKQQTMGWDSPQECIRTAMLLVRHLKYP